MMLPILISLSVAPWSYFFSAAAASAPMDRARATNANRTPLIRAMPTSLMPSADCRSADSLGLRHRVCPALGMTVADVRVAGLTGSKRLGGVTRLVHDPDPLNSSYQPRATLPAST